MTDQPYLRRVGVGVLASVALLLTGAGLAEAFPPGNRVVNPGAEEATLTDWEQDGFASVEYGSAARYPPAERHFFGGGDGERLFAASVTGARLSQTVDVADLAASIDAGDQFLYGGGDLGAAAGSSDTIELRFQPLDAAGDALGQPVVIGRPTDSDRLGTTRMVPCDTVVRPPPGTRGVALTLLALGAPGDNLAFADAIYLTDQPVAIPAVLVAGDRPADGPGCRAVPDPQPTPPPPASSCGDPEAAGYLHPAKLRVSRARVMGEDRRLDVLAPITSRARGGDVAVTYQGDGRSDTFDAEVTQSASELDHIRFREPITAGQAELGTGIVNLNYLGDEDTRPEFVRLRAASQRAELDVEQISLIGDRLSGQGSVTGRAEGIVRLRYSYLNPDGTPNVHEARAEIQDDGDWELQGDQVPAQLAQCGGYLSIQFTGYLPQRIRGEQLAYQLNAGQTRRP
jgi:hypothetical protein